MKYYNSKHDIEPTDTFELILEHFHKVEKYIKNNRVLQEYLEEDFMNTNILIKEYTEFSTSSYRRKELLQLMVDINNYLVKIINKNVDEISDEVIEFLIEKKRQLRINKINRIIDFD